MADIINYIEPFYNQIRLQHKLFVLGNISPVEYEMKLLKCAETSLQILLTITQHDNT